mmetsp:Transcript_11940/g.22373  ORF Transcript_11940/g.22373 Transcript_11940/m.22373 type:complete len:179 (+) Transcript_11940:133-669(+)
MKTVMSKQRLNVLKKSQSSSGSGNSMAASLLRRRRPTPHPTSRPLQAALKSPSSSSSNSSISPTLSLLTNVVKAKSDLQWFENFAGRSAMLGFFTAAYFEEVTGSGVFQNFGAVQDDNLLLFLARASAGAALLLLVIWTRARLKGKLPEDVSASFADFSSNDGNRTQICRVLDDILES